MSCAILVVDDDPDFIELVQSVLQADGYEVVGCTNSGIALETARSSRPVLIFLDLFMPQPTGWDILRDLREDPLFVSTPVLVVSAMDAEDALASRGQTADFDPGPIDSLPKPFEIDELIMRVRELLPRDAAISQSAESNDPSTSVTRLVG